MKKILVILAGAVGILAVGNLVFLDWQFFNQSQKETPLVNQVQEENKVAIGSCQLACREIIEEEIKQELAKVPSPAGQSSVSPVAPIRLPTQTNTKPKIVYVPLITDGSVSSVDWAEVVPSEFYFDLSNYPGVKEVRFETYASSLNNDKGYARLYDQTNKRGVDYSELLFSKSEFIRIESSAIKIWNGNNKYTVQLRSVNGTKVQVKEAKLKIYY